MSPITQLNLLTSRATSITGAASIGVILLLTPIAHGWEWETRCGKSKQSLTICTISKGDSALNGENGMLYTYELQSGEKYQRFMGTKTRGRIGNEHGYMRSQGNKWFPIRTTHRRDLIIHTLPSGNIMLVEKNTSP